jgi:amino acid permease
VGICTYVVSCTGHLLTLELGILFGILVVAVLGLTTFCCYYFLWQAFLDADSVQYPAKTLQSLAERVLGLPLGALIGLAQLTQLLIIASTLVLSTGRLLSQLINGVDSESVGGQMKLCFMIILAISAGLAVTSSFARRLRFHLGSSHVFVVILLAGCICVMLSAHRDGPITYTADIQVAFSGIYNSATSLKEKLNALMQLVFAFGAGICLVEIMSEVCAQLCPA